jgi:uncharacterized membrane protein YkvA (DUF1232 family)
MTERDDGPERASSGLSSTRPHGDPLGESASERKGREGLEPGGEAPLPSLGLLSFYDRLRATIVGAVERRGSRLGHRTVEVLLLVPDVFILLVRLALDPRVPSSSRAMIGGALAYFVMPIDLLPEATLGAVGYVDDLVLAAVVLSHVLGPELEPLARKYWSGSQDLRRTLSELVAAARTLLGANLHERLSRLLARRGISLEEIEREALADQTSSPRPSPSIPGV